MGLDSSLGAVKQPSRVTSHSKGVHDTNGTKSYHHTVKMTSLLSKFIESHRELDSYK